MMITALAHVTSLEAPVGILLMSAGFVLGVLVTLAVRRFRLG